MSLNLYCLLCEALFYCEFARNIFIYCHSCSCKKISSYILSILAPLTMKVLRLFSIRIWYSSGFVISTNDGKLKVKYSS